MFFLQKQDSPKVQWDHHLSALKPPRLPRKKKKNNNFLHWIQTHNDFARHLFELVVNPFEPKKNGQNHFLVHLPPRFLDWKEKIFWNHLDKNSPFKGAQLLNPTPKIKGYTFCIQYGSCQNMASQWIFMKVKKRLPPRVDPRPPRASSPWLGQTEASHRFFPNAAPPVTGRKHGKWEIKWPQPSGQIVV